MSDTTVSRTPSRPYGRLALAALLAMLTLLLIPTAAGAAPPTSPLTTDPADAGAGWLTGEFTDGDHLSTEFDLNGDGTIDPLTEVFPDYGLTADAVLAFAAAGSAGDAAEAATDYLAANVAGYAGDGITESYAGSLAKLVIVADVMGRDPLDFGGRDLIAELTAREQTSGRFADLSAFGDYSNGFTQSLAVIALDRATANGASTAAVEYLVAQQCADGGFNSVLEVSPCAGEVDTSAFAVQALDVAGRDAARDTTTGFLLGQQAADGSFAASGFGTPPVTTANSNSTGLAAQALSVLGESEAAGSAVSWLLDRQVGADGPQEQQGAFAFDATGFDPANATRATTQAVLGVAGIGFADLVAPTDPLAYGLDVGGGGALPPPPGTGPPPGAGPPPPPAELPATGAAPGGLLELGVGLLAIGVAGCALARRRTDGLLPTRTSP